VPTSGSGSRPGHGDVLGGIALPGSEAHRHTLLVRRWGYALTTAALVLLLGVAVADGLGAVDAYGVDTAHVSAEADGTVLDVGYTTVTRAALASPFEITVHRRGGFDGPITVAVDHRYLELWDENGLYPAPAAETTMGPWVVWEFDPPEGDTLRFTYDARLEPGAQRGRAGAVALLDGGLIVAEVAFETDVRP
jgi:hypothetical protein